MRKMGNIEIEECHNILKGACTFFIMFENYPFCMNSFRKIYKKDRRYKFPTWCPLEKVKVSKNIKYRNFLNKFL